MNVNVIKSGKNELEIEIDNLTIAELLRKFLWEDSSTVAAAWKREHPSSNPILVLQTKGKNARTVMLDAVEKINKINKTLEAEFKKAVK